MLIKKLKELAVNIGLHVSNFVYRPIHACDVNIILRFSCKELHLKFSHYCQMMAMVLLT